MLKPSAVSVSLLALAHDISERIEAEQQVIESEQRLARILASVSDVVCEADLQGNLIYVNETGYRKFGYTEEDFARGLSVIQMIAPEDHEQAGENLKRILTGEDIGASEYTGITRSGRRFPILIHSTPFMKDGQPAGLMAVIVDITEIRESQELEQVVTEELRNERDRIQTILDLVAEIVVVLEKDGTVGAINRKGCLVLGCQEEEIVGKDWFEYFIPAEISDSVRVIFDELIAGNIDLVERYENPVLTASGEVRIIDWHNSVLYDEEGGILNIISSGTDITDQKELEQQLIQAQKMEAVGRLAGGIAHDFNNLLTVISGSVELAEKESDISGIQTRLETIQKASQQAADLTSQLLTFSRKQFSLPVLVQLNAAVDESLKILRRVLGEDVQLEIETTKESVPVEIDPGQLNQVLMNLVVNAKDAITSGGTIRIRTDRIELGPEMLQARSDMEPGEFALMSVEDTGEGMTLEQKASIFDPFFTTKEPGKGTGLGMATVYGIVTQHGGLIDVQSELGSGTSVHVYLPISSLVDEEVETEGGKDTRLRGSERICIVEDEDAVRDLASEILTEYGYEVFTHGDPVEALELLMALKKKERPDLVIADVIMPGMSGVQMVSELKRKAKGLKALLMSGYTDDALEEKGLAGTEYELLMKPFTIEELCLKVRKVLDNTD